MKVDLKDKVAVITGGGGILCSVMAKAMAKAGAKVAILDLRAEAAEQVAAEIVADGGESLCDFSAFGAKFQMYFKLGAVGIADFAVHQLTDESDILFAVIHSRSLSFLWLIRFVCMTLIWRKKFRFLSKFLQVLRGLGTNGSLRFPVPVSARRKSPRSSCR